MKKMEAPGGNLLDLRFLDMMTPHHQGAITMSKEALDRAEHAEIKTLANKITYNKPYLQEQKAKSSKHIRFVFNLKL